MLPSTYQSAAEPETRLVDTADTHDEKTRDEIVVSGPSSSSAGSDGKTATPPAQGASSLAERFGYCEDSNSNTLALIRKLGLDEEIDHDAVPITGEAVERVKRLMKRLPDRSILDFLIQHFLAEVDWIDRLIYPPWLLAQYKQWWTKEQLEYVVDIDFVILVLRICSYASQFLPSPNYTADRIRGIPLSDIRSTCDGIAYELVAISNLLDGSGSLLRVQYYAFLGLGFQSEGKTKSFWQALSCAIRIAQSAGMHKESPVKTHRMDELEKEMRRRTFCNLYVWDSLLSRQLDRVPFLPDGLSEGTWPKMRLMSHIGDGTVELDADALESFAERLFQARLAAFWDQFGLQIPEYDMMMAEERYDQFCKEFLPTLPPSFALYPNKTWDKCAAKLPLQRQLLRISIFESLCWNFRPVVLSEPGAMESLPTYKRVLLCTQRKVLAAAALHVLDAVASLHVMLGGSHTRFIGLIYPSFEAAVLLVCLCVDPHFPNDPDGRPLPALKGVDPKTDPLRASMAAVTREGCLRAINDALDRLNMLAEISSMAEVGAHTLVQLLGKLASTGVIDRQPDVTSSLLQTSTLSNQQMNEWSSLELTEPGWVGPGQLDELLSAIMSQQSQNQDWEALVDGFVETQSGDK
ncbi:hypothetical protein TruAng_006482 [Truncatella angustata]|nr:hypothetical protein TruAng_006482 [Truncatella angustata]